MKHAVQELAFTHDFVGRRGCERKDLNPLEDIDLCLSDPNLRSLDGGCANISQRPV